MNIDYSSPGKLIFSIIDYIRKMLDDILEDMIENYFTKVLQVIQLRWFYNIILGIHEDVIPAYNASGRAFIEEQKLKLKKEKELSQKAAKLASE